MAYLYDSDLDAFELWHKQQEEESTTSILGGPLLPALGHATSGSLGSAISNVITYPLSLVITRLQVQSQFENKKDGNNDADYTSIADAIQKIYTREGGISAFYAGCPQDTAKSMADSFLFFLAYNSFRRGRLNTRPGTKRLPVHEEIGVGMLAGAFSRFFTTPIQQIVTRKQTASMIAARSGDASVAESLSVREIAGRIRDEKGLAGFWSGYSATLVLTLNPALTFLFHETLLRLFVKRDQRENPGSRMTFLIAAMSKACASCITYPFSLAKSRAQVSAKAPMELKTEAITEKDTLTSATTKAEQKVRRKTVFDIILEIAREEGLLGLYQGLGGEVLKGFFSHGLTMLLKERIHKVIIQLYYFVLKAMQKFPSQEDLAQLASEKATEAKTVATSATEGVSDAVEKGTEMLKDASYQGQEVVDKGISTVSGLYRRGKEASTDIVDEYINTGDDDD
ncbi:mitochondrial carrier [Venturia nashicola]|nr:mitochondrial carrier [Venturia nashicola]